MARKMTAAQAEKNKTAKFENVKLEGKKQIWNERYADETATANRYDRTVTSSASTLSTAAAVRSALSSAIKKKSTIIDLSRQLYATNPIYANVINYLSNIFSWRYKVVPHKLTGAGKAAAGGIDEAIYNLMLEVVDGIEVEVTYPKLLSQMFINGSVFFTTVGNEDSRAVDTIILPNKYCRKVGETQFGTGIMALDRTYFEQLGLSSSELDAYLTSFSPEIRKAYNKYKGNSSLRWTTLDPRFSGCILQNEYAIPTLFYIYSGILNYEKYQDNELERNGNLLKYIVTQTMPVYQDRLIFENDEVRDLHQARRRVIEQNGEAKLLTTYGTVNVQHIGVDDSTQSEVLDKALDAIYNNGSINPVLFTGDSAEALKAALVRDQNRIWKYVEEITKFYTVAINNWFDFKGYQADMEILRISPFTYQADLDAYRNNATLGVGKLDYIIASGVKQKHIQDNFELEDFLGLDRVTPRQTSYTQAPEDRDDSDEEDEPTSEKSGDTITGQIGGNKKTSNNNNEAAETASSAVNKNENAKTEADEEDGDGNGGGKSE